jgi:hypothetical protein
MRIHMPRVFGDFYAVLRFRDRLYAEVEAGHMTWQNYRRRVRVMCKAYREESERRAFYARPREVSS